MGQVFDLNSWLEQFQEKLIQLFGTRLRFFGLQGSYGRGGADDYERYRRGDYS